MHNHKIYTNVQTLTEIGHLTCATLHSTVSVLLINDNIYNLSRHVGQ
jgi:hypothetical protein